MMVHVYIDALLVNTVLADRVWEIWQAGDLDNRVAKIAWREIAKRRLVSEASIENFLESLHVYPDDL